MPAAGPVTHWTMAAGPGVRIDTAMAAGDRVPPEYDPLIAKLLVHAGTRDAAIDRLRRALDETEVGGIQTTLPFDRFVVRHPSFRAADLSTGWVERWWDGAAQRRSAVEVALLAGGLVALDGGGAGEGVPLAVAATGEGRSRDGSPGGSRDGTWRAAGRTAAIDRWPR